MRRIKRRPLADETVAFLRNERTNKVLAKPRGDARKAEVARLWELKNNKAFRDVRKVLRTMASGLERCMYCEDSQGTDIEHFWPKTPYPERAFDWHNYLLACSKCNSNEKRDQFPLDQTGKPLLIDPTSTDKADDPYEHLQLSPRTGEFNKKTPRGETNIEVFGLNRSKSMREGRRNAWVALKKLIVVYATEVREDKREDAEQTLKVIQEYPFSAVLYHLLAMSKLKNADALLGPECVAAVEEHRQALSAIF